MICAVATLVLRNLSGPGMSGLYQDVREAVAKTVARWTASRLSAPPWFARRSCCRRRIASSEDEGDVSLRNNQLGSVTGMRARKIRRNSEGGELEVVGSYRNRKNSVAAMADGGGSI